MNEHLEKAVWDATESMSPEEVNDLRDEMVGLLLYIMGDFDDEEEDEASDEDFDCMDCGFNTFHGHEYYVVHDDLWLTAVPNQIGMLCIACLEQRLGRVLTPEDFRPIEINTPVFSDKSDRLMSRLGL